MSERRPPTAREQAAIEVFRAQLNRREHQPEELLDRRSRHGRLVAAMRAELAAATAAKGTDASP